jgi:hypothetical protein
VFHKNISVENTLKILFGGVPSLGLSYCFFFGGCSKPVFNPSTHKKSAHFSRDPLKTEVFQGRPTI